MSRFTRNLPHSSQTLAKNKARIVIPLSIPLSGIPTATPSFAPAAICTQIIVYSYGPVPAARDIRPISNGLRLVRLLEGSLKKTLVTDGSPGIGALYVACRETLTWRLASVLDQPRDVRFSVWET